MKKTLWIAIAGALAASVIAASAQEVLSANAVGYIKKTLPAGGKLVAVSIPLDSMTEANNVFGRTSIAQEAPVNSWAYFWTGISWAGGMKTTKGWGGLSNRVIVAGESFFMKGDPADAISRDVTITGEVPDDGTLQRAITGGGNLTSVANPYPVDFVFGNSSIASNASVDSWAYFWTGASWAGGMKTTKGWGGLSNRLVSAGEGFFIKEVNTGFTWTNDKPYTWP
jgi:hypothetical protein